MSLFNTSSIFKHDGQNQAQHKASTKEIQSDAIAMSTLVKLAQKQGPSDACQAPSSQNATMDGAELLGAIYIAQIGRHTRKAAAIAGNDDKNQGLEHEAVLYICQQVEGYDFDNKEGDISIATTNVI